MATYLATEEIRRAVWRLGRSRAHRTLTDYLIFKRAWVLQDRWAQEEGREHFFAVTTGTANKAFATAVDEMARCADAGDEWDGPPYFTPFGAARDSSFGFRGHKYASNGPSDTANRWQSRTNSPLLYVEGTSPKQFSFALRTERELAAFFLVKTGDAPRPQMYDLAVWWFRRTDLDTVVNGDPSPRDLMDACRDELDLTDDELDGLFSWDEEVALFDAPD